VLFRELGAAPAAAFQLIGGRLYTFDPDGVATAWSVDPFRRLWRYHENVRNVRTVGGGGVLLGTTVLDARTGAVRWRAPGPVTPVDGGRIGLIRGEIARPGTGYDEVTGFGGPLFADPPARTTLLAVDMRTGRELWASSWPGGVIVGGAPAGLIVLTADRVRLVAAETGKVLRSRPLVGGYPADMSGYVPVIGDLVLIRHYDTLTAYAARTLDRVWERPMPPEDSLACHGMLCDQDESGVTVLDPGTGKALWRAGGGSTLTARGGTLTELSNRQDRPLRTRDIRTGAVRADLRAWRWLAPGPDGTLVLGRPSGSGTVVVSLPAGRREIQPLGYAGTPATDCQSTAGFLACRTGKGIEVWSYL
jgi:outer membrane protein assembly factor BamB